MGGRVTEVILGGAGRCRDVWKIFSPQNFGGRLQRVSVLGWCVIGQMRLTT